MAAWAWCPELSAFVLQVSKKVRWNLLWTDWCRCRFPMTGLLDEAFKQLDKNRPLAQPWWLLIDYSFSICFVNGSLAWKSSSQFSGSSALIWGPHFDQVLDKVQAMLLLGGHTMDKKGKSTFLANLLASDTWQDETDERWWCLFRKLEGNVTIPKPQKWFNRPKSFLKWKPFLSCSATLLPWPPPATDSGHPRLVLPDRPAARSFLQAVAWPKAKPSKVWNP